jgi:hypothetical protein
MKERPYGPIVIRGLPLAKTVQKVFQHKLAAIKDARWRKEMRECRIACREVREVPGVSPNLPTRPDELVAAIRRLAGINAQELPYHPHAVPIGEWLDWNRGLPGFRKCGPGFWDNVIRAWEDG